MTDEEFIYRDEPIIGHHIEVVLEEREPDEWLVEAAERCGMTLRERPDFVRITEGDVDWDEVKSLKINVEQLREIALRFTDLEEP